MRHIRLGASDFAGRYVAVFKSAWKSRGELDPPKRNADELAFLPAHLELTNSPASPAARWTMRTIIAFFCVVALWASLGKLDIVAVAPGKFVVDSRTKMVQSAEAGVVRQIFVRDGEVVKKGQLLIELDATATGAEREQVVQSLINARLATLRLDAMVASLSSNRSPVMSSDVELPEGRVEAEQALARSQFDTYQARRQGLRASIEQRKAELRTLQAAITPLDESARISRARAADYGSLVEGQYVGRHEYLLREQERIAAERELSTHRSRLQEIRSAISAAEEELRVLMTDTRQQALDQLRLAGEEVRQLTLEVAKTGQRDRLMKLRAPVDGSVQQLAVHTVGGVVTPAQTLLAVVPSDEALEVEAAVLNKDIGFVRAGQRVTLKIESFPYTRYGFLTGTVLSVSNDAAQDERMGPVFPIRVGLDKAIIELDGVRFRMTPGMSLSAEIKTGKRRVADYLLSPIERHGREALRER